MNNNLANIIHVLLAIAYAACVVLSAYSAILERNKKRRRGHEQTTKKTS